MDKPKHGNHSPRTHVNASQYGCLPLLPVLGRQNGIYKANYEVNKMETRQSRHPESTSGFFPCSHKHAHAPARTVHPPTGKHKMQISNKKTPENWQTI